MRILLSLFARGVPSLRRRTAKSGDAVCRSVFGNRRRPKRVKAPTQLGGRNSTSLNFFINCTQSTRDSQPRAFAREAQQLPPDEEFGGAAQITPARFAPMWHFASDFPSGLRSTCNELIQGCLPFKRRCGGHQPGRSEALHGPDHIHSHPVLPKPHAARAVSSSESTHTGSGMMIASMINCAMRCPASSVNASRP